MLKNERMSIRKDNIKLRWVTKKKGRLEIRNYAQRKPIQKKGDLSRGNNNRRTGVVNT